MLRYCSFLLVCLLPVLAGMAQGTESFTNLPAANSAYTLQNWTGDNGLPWSATDSRTDQSMNGRAIVVRNGAVNCNNIPNGLSSISFNHQQFFGGTGGVLEVYINNTLVGTANPTLTSTTLSITGLNITGTFNLEIRQVTAGLRIGIDDINWVGNNNIPCADPLAQPAGLSLSATPASVSGSFTAAVPAPDAYLVVRSTSGTLSANPADATVYSPGQSLGAGTVISLSSASSFTDLNLSPSTTYYYFVFALNDQDCMGGPNYFNSSPLSGNISTPALPACTTAAAATGLSLTPANAFITGNFIAAAGANRYLTVISTSPTLSTSPVNGTVYTGGQSFGGGTVVSYNSSTSFTASGLSANTLYHLFIFSANAECAGEPFYNSSALAGSTTTTNTSTGIPSGYYNSAQGLDCQPLKTALRNIISNGYNSLSYTPGVWNAYQYTDIHRNDGNTADIIWDIYTDDPAGSETFTFTFNTDQCGSYNSEGDCYNREHTTPQSWFNSASPMVSDVHHIFPTDGWVNGKRANFPYGEVSAATYTSIDNQSKLGSGNNYGYTGTIFEPHDAFKGDLARVSLYMATRYENELINENWAGNIEAAPAMLSATDEPDPAKRKLQVYETWYIRTMFDWMSQDPVSQKEIDRNNGIYYQSGQSNRNPFVDHPEYAAMIWQCSGVIPVTIIDFTGSKQQETIILRWQATYETSFKKFEIERSTDGLVFNKIGEVAGRNLYNYSFTDAGLPNSSVVYYRLKMIDIDGRYSYSRITVIRLDNNFSNALVYPNPTIGNLNLKLLHSLNSNSTLQVLDIAGRIVQQQQVAINEVNVKVDVNKLSAGRYFIRIFNSTQVINQSFVVIQ